ncbi:hypothetical protein ACTXT7_001712 [Hymenolepis weldensis]
MILNEPGFSEEIEDDDGLLENGEPPQFCFHQNSFDNGHDWVINAALLVGWLGHKRGKSWLSPYIALAAALSFVSSDKNPFRKKTTKSQDFEIEDMTNLSKLEQSNLGVLKYKLNHALLELIKAKHKDPDVVRKINLSPDLVTILKIDNEPLIDIDVALKKIKERLDEIDKEKVEIFNEVEISKVLDRWEDHINDTATERVKAKEEFEAKKMVHHKQEKFHEPGSQALEKDVWKNEDEMPEDNYSPRNFFLIHDLNSDGVWDSEEISAVLNSEFDQLDEDRPERAEEYRIQMRQSLMKLVDKNQDGVIDYGEHMDYINSSKAATDNGWEARFIIFSPDDDEDEDLDDFGPIPDDKELDEIAAKIRHFESTDPNSKLIEQLKDRFVHLKREIELNRSRHP